MKPRRENRDDASEPSNLLVIVPSRGRPGNIGELQQAWRDTSATADLLVGLDIDDPTIIQYPASGQPPSVYDVGPRLGMCGTLNKLAVEQTGDYFAIGFCGDDHRPRTPGWDTRVLDALNELGTGIVYGNDLIHGEGLPTAVFITSDIVRALGYMAPPRQRHLYLDNAWLALGQALDAITYLPDVVIEHVHPIAGKAEWDEGYVRVNSADIQEHDRVEFERWREHDLPGAVDTIRAACG